jgi:L-glyceraldehyde 3-phosphate reductase
MNYLPSTERYEQMKYRRCGLSGIKLPAVSLGLWHNFGHVDNKDEIRKILFAAFDAGITHFDLANNYGPPPGSAEENFGKILNADFASYRDEMIISTKAGYLMWPGPYGDFGSRKYMISSLDQSLRRMGIDYVDIFYHHRPDPETPLEESMMALDHAVRSGKALYAGISNYPPEKTKEAATILKSLGTPCLIHQPKYSMLVRDPEDGLLSVLEEEGIGCIPFSPLAQGLLTEKYLQGIPEGSRADKSHGFLKKHQITPELIKRISELNEMAKDRGQSLAQMALSWLLKDSRVTSVLIGASSVNQLHDSIGALENIEFSREELDKIENLLKI